MDYTPEFEDTAETMGQISYGEMRAREQILIGAGFSRCPDDMPVGPDTAEIEFTFIGTSAFWRAK